MPIQTRCLNCEVQLRPPASRIKDGKGKFCSRNCCFAFKHRRENVANRFWQYVDKSGGPNACWPWLAHIGNQGYGQFRISTHKMAHAHRFAYELTFGAVGDDVLIRHTCDTHYPLGDKTYRRCTNPLHLQSGAHTDNMTDMITANRQAKGERAHKAKLTVDLVRSIRDLFSTGKYTNIALAEVFGVNDRSISMIVRNKTWRHVE